MNDTDKLQALDTYFRLMSMKGGVEVFHAARRAGILNAVAAGTSSPAAVAERCGLDPHATTLTLAVLAALGLLAKTAAGYVPAPVLGFLTGTYADLSSQYWAHLPEYLKSGLPMQRMDDPAEGMKHYAEQAASLFAMMLPAAMATARLLQVGTIRKNLRILDIGAGSGVWSLTLAQHDPGASVTAVDWPAVLQVAAGYAAKLGLSGRFTAIPGDYHTVDFGDQAYDLAVAANVAHLETEGRLQSVLSRLSAGLKAGGLLVLADVFHDQPGGELNAALYELGLALRTRQGRVHDRAALEACIAQSGFTNPAYHPLPVTPRTMGLIIAQKGT